MLHVDGVMIGRAAYEDPYIFAEADKKIFNDKDAPIRSRTEIVHACLDYADAWVKNGGRLHAVSRHLLTLFARQAGARIFRRHISEQAPRPESDSKVLVEALKMMQDAKPKQNQLSLGAR